MEHVDIQQPVVINDEIILTEGDSIDVHRKDDGQEEAPKQEESVDVSDDDASDDFDDRVSQYAD